MERCHWLVESTPNNVIGPHSPYQRMKCHDCNQKTLLQIQYNTPLGIKYIRSMFKNKLHGLKRNNLTLPNILIRMHSNHYKPKMILVINLENTFLN